MNKLNLFLIFHGDPIWDSPISCLYYGPKT